MFWLVFGAVFCVFSHVFIGSLLGFVCFVWFWNAFYVPFVFFVCVCLFFVEVLYVCV